MTMVTRMFAFLVSVSQVRLNYVLVLVGLFIWP
jgi:hypothetical protein